MLIKQSQADKRNKPGTIGKQVKPIGSKTVSSSSTGGGTIRLHRKVLRVCPAKRPPVTVQSEVPPARTPGARHRPEPPQQIHEHDNAAMDACDNSNDSGLGLEHSSSPDINISTSSESAMHLDMAEDSLDSDDPQPRLKRARMAIKAEQSEEDEEVKENFCFSVTKSSLQESKDINSDLLLLPLSGPTCASTRDGRVTLSIVAQPEQQHRARYQTEGSRGAVKDRSGQGFPIVKLTGYDKPAMLQVFIGSDVDRVAPHMFYQACRVCGKNSTPCVEKKVEGTVVIELQFETAKNNVVTCDCVGILKERNVDVEHRFPDETVPRNKKKSTRCRMVFRTCVSRPDGTYESLQVVSQPIACTQLPGVPEINKRSLNASSCAGGSELFLLGKNFLKDSRVVFQQPIPSATSNMGPFVWEEEVIPDKEFLQPTHLVCVVPPFHRQDLKEAVAVRLFVRSSGKCSESQTFTYLPDTPALPVVVAEQALPSKLIPANAEPLPSLVEPTISNKTVTNAVIGMKSPQILPSLLTAQTTFVPTTTVLKVAPSSHPEKSKPGVAHLQSQAMPILIKGLKKVNHPILIDIQRLKQLLETPAAAQNQTMCPTEASLLRQFVSENTGSPLPAQSGSSVEKFLLRIESGDSIPVKGPNAETFVSSTSIDFQEVKGESLTPLPRLAPEDTRIPPSPQATSLVNIVTSTQLHQDLLCNNIAEKCTSSESPLMEAAMTCSAQSSTASLQQDLTLPCAPLSKITTTVLDQLSSPHLNMGSSNLPSSILSNPVLEHVIGTVAPNHPDSTNQDMTPMIDTQSQSPIMQLLNSSTLLSSAIMQEVSPSGSDNFTVQTSSNTMNSQLMGHSEVNISEPLVQSLGGPASLLDNDSPLLVSHETMNLLSQAFESNKSTLTVPLAGGHLLPQPAETSVLVQSLSDPNIGHVQDINLLPPMNHREISQEMSILPPMTQTDIVPDTQLLDEPLLQPSLSGRTAMSQEGMILNHNSADVPSGPLLRDVLLGVRGGAAPLLVQSSELGHRIDHSAEGPTKKVAEGMLPQELTHMSEKDLLSYINPGCFDQVIP